MIKRYPVILLLIFFLLKLTDAAAEKQSRPILFYHEKSSAPELKELVNSYDYRKYISSGKDEFRKMILLKNWVYKKISYNFKARDKSLRNALKILHSSKYGEHFVCANLAAVFMQSALSLGWTSRYFFFRNSTGDKHATNDVWSNKFNKWIFIDVTWNLHLEKKGVPLSIAEAREQWLKNRGRDLVYVFGAGKERVEYRYSDFPVRRNDSKVWSRHPLDWNWLAYTKEVALVGRNDFFTLGDGDGRNIWDHIYIIKDRHNSEDKKWAFRNKKPVKKIEDMFHKLNHALINIEQRPVIMNDELFTINVLKWKSILKVDLRSSGKKSYTPYFKAFFIRVDDGEWVRGGKSFFWVLKPGLNILRVRIVNTFGVFGPVSIVRIMY